MSTGKFLKNSGIYIAVSVLQKATAFFLLPLYTAYLSPEDYGVLSVITSVTSLLSVFFLLSLNGAATRFHFDNINNETRVREVWGTIFTFVLINSIVLGSVFIVSHKYLINPFTKGISFYPFLFLGILTTIVSPLYLFFQTYLQTLQKGVHYGINMLLNFLVNIGLIILFVVVFEMGVLGFLYANLITALIFFAYVIFAFLPKISIGIKRRSVLNPAFRYSLPLIPHSLSSWIMSMVDRIFVNNLTGKVETGLYSVGYQFGNIVNVLTTAVNQAYIPWFFEKEKQGREGIKQIVKVAELLTVVYCFVALTISLFSSEVLKIMVTKKFQSAKVFIPFISFAYVFSGLYYFYVNVLFLGKTKRIPIITFGSAIVGVVLNLLLIPIWGGVGASISSLTSLAVSSVLALLFAQIADKRIRFKWLKMYLIVVLFLTISLTVHMLPDSTSYLFSIASKTLLLLLLFVIFYILYRKDVSLMRKLLFRR